MEEKFGKNTENDIEVDEITEDYVDEIDEEGIEELSQEKLKKLKEKLRQSDKDKMAALEELQRLRADFLNARKRLDDEKIRDRERVKIDHIERLLPLCDSFGMALQDRGFADLPANLQKGIRGIESQLSSILKSYGVDEINPEGLPFDPYEHEAIAQNGEGNNVEAVLQKGYKLGDIIIRPAKVAVGK
ncbi:nucleotide exchange factor GrpE [Candidatus Kaiserbacteria bacterium RIFCSPHIGHO2_01_FULL_46_22]|uniref:Protein GrpE n=1 Tax=Candidatus Kaiserbacteria bacterium RIFCSPHIGHO2_01_FULL_46_22 TaxID=1798475 RepID=A0A1F6BY25_9BACT|nr:MAG: nucleotide exchange factor GrpE [Candidatus Kaiserbacteria bacterium RIFCSPHIGHO2_01_FULL_46_22]